MSVVWNKSGFVERDDNDQRAPGAKAYFFVGNTTTPFTVFQDANASAAHPHPLVADSNARWPTVFIPYTASYDVRVTTSTDIQLYYHINIPNPNPVENIVTIPPEEKIQTGMMHFEFANDAGATPTKPGFVRCNGGSIGNAASSGTERANADTSNLFTYLWNNMADAQAAVLPGGRGGSAAADFAANKRIAIPDLRCSQVIGVDGMGRTPVGGLAAQHFYTGNATTIGSLVGDNNLTLSLAQIPAHSHTVNITSSTESATHTHALAGVGAQAVSVGSAHQHSGTTAIESASHGHASGVITTSDANATHTHTGTTDNGGIDHSHTVSGTTSAGSAHTHGAGIETVGHTHSGTTDVEVATHSHTYLIAPNRPSASTGGQVGGVNASGIAGNIWYGVDAGANTGSQSVTHTHTFTSGAESANHTHTIDAESTHTHTFGATSSGASAVLHAHNFTTAANVATHQHTFSFTTGAQNANHTHTFTSNLDGAHTHTLTGSTDVEGAAHAHSVSGSTNSQGSGSVVPMLSFSYLGTWYIKL